MTKCKHSTGFYMNLVNSLTSVPKIDLIVVVHQATVHVPWRPIIYIKLVNEKQLTPTK